MRTIDVIALAVTVAVCGIAPLTLALILARRMRLPLRIVAIAAGFYAVNLLLQQPIFASLRPLVGGMGPLLLTAVVPSIIYGVTEETVRYLSWRAGPTMRNNRTSDGAIVAGLAWGGAESLLFTLSLLFGVIAAVFAPGLLQGAPTAAVLAAGSAGSLAVFLPGRLFAIAGHLAFAHLSVQAYRRSTAYLPVVIIAHIVFDASVFGLAVQLGYTSLWPTVLFAALAAVAIAIVIRLRRTWAAERNLHRHEITVSARSAIDGDHRDVDPRSCPRAR